jgi:hypothetical protein
MAMSQRRPGDNPGGAASWATLIGIAGIAATEACGPAPGGPGAASPAGLTGKWTGAVSGGSESVPIQFAITDEGGTLSGEGHIGDPVTGKFDAGTGPLTGSLNAGQATWTMPGGLAAAGKLEGNSFKGTLQFPPEEGAQAPLIATLTLKR